MKTRAIALALLLVAAIAQAQVKAHIDAPPTVAPGDLVILKSDRSVGTTFKWLLVNSKKTFFAADGGKTCLFSSGQPGDYIFVLIVAGADTNNRLDVAMVEHTVTVTGAVPPAPVVVVPPNPIPPPEPVPNPTRLAAQLIVLRDQTTVTTKQVAVLLDLQAKYQKGSQPEMYLLDKQDTSKLTTAYNSLKPAAKAFPYYFLVGKDGSVLAQGELASTTEENVANIAKYQEKQ